MCSRIPCKLVSSKSSSPSQACGRVQLETESTDEDGGQHDRVTAEDRAISDVSIRPLVPLSRSDCLNLLSLNEGGALLVDTGGDLLRSQLACMRLPVLEKMTYACHLGSRGGCGEAMGEVDVLMVVNCRETLSRFGRKESLALLAGQSGRARGQPYAPQLIRSTLYPNPNHNTSDSMLHLQLS